MSGGASSELEGAPEADGATESERLPETDAFVNGPFTMPPSLRTERLWLVPFGMHHRTALAAFHADEASNRYIAGAIDEVGSFARLCAMAGQWSLLGFGFYAILNETHEFLGFAGLNCPINWPELELGYALMPEARGKGYAVEAARAIRAEAARGGAPALVSYVHPDNAASIALATKLGAVPEGEVVLDGSLARVFRHTLPASQGQPSPDGEVVLEATAMPLTIAAEGFVLRHPCAADFEAYAAMLADGCTTRFIGGPASRSQAWRSFAANTGHWALRGYGVYIIEADGAFAGFCGLYHPIDWPEPELAYTLAPHARGQGLASAAAKAVATVAAEQGLSALVSYISPDNHRSLAMAQRVGCRAEPQIVLRGDPAIPHRHPMPPRENRPVVERLSAA